MANTPLMRTQHRDVGTNGVLGGYTGHGDNLTDMESSVLPQARMTSAAFLSWGVADGLVVKATVNTAGVSVLPGLAFDAAGHLIVLAGGGYAITQAGVDPTAVRSVPLVSVDPTNGVTLATTAITGDQYLTITWREVEGYGTLPNSLAMLQTPWLRLQPVTGFQDVGDQVILARVTLNASSQVTALALVGRRLAGLEGQRLELRAPGASTTSGLRVDQAAVAELRAHIGGGAEINMLPSGTQALIVDSTGNVGIGTSAPGAMLEINRGTADVVALKLTSGAASWGSGLQLSNTTATTGRNYGMYAGSDGKWHFTDNTAAAERLIILPSGNVGIGTTDPKARLSLGTATGQALLVHQNDANNVRSGFGVDMSGGRELAAFFPAGAGGHFSIGTMSEDGNFTYSEKARLDTAGNLLLNGNLTVVTTANNNNGQGIGTWWHTIAATSTRTNNTFNMLRFEFTYPTPTVPELPKVHVLATSGLAVDGPITGTSKSFVIDHPLDPAGQELVHASLEGPEHGVYYRGRAQLVDGRQVIELPRYFEALTRPDMRTVLLTPTFAGEEAVSQLAASEVIDGCFTVRAIDGRNPSQKFDWHVCAVRADIDALVPERPKVA